jgi:hypothetical protein
MGWTIGVLGFDSRRWLGIFLFTTVPRTALDPTQTPMQWVPGAPSLGVKRPGREADQSPHLVPRSNNEWSYISIPQYAFMAWCSVKNKAQGQLYFIEFEFISFTIARLSAAPCILKCEQTPNVVVRKPL